jgi:hypothetical protein
MNRTGQQSCLMRLPRLRGIERDCFEPLSVGENGACISALLRRNPDGLY